MAHTGSTHAPNAAQGNGVTLQATMKASIDARLSWGRLAGAAEAPVPAPPPSHPICMAAPSGAGAARGGAALRCVLGSIFHYVDFPDNGGIHYLTDTNNGSSTIWQILIRLIVPDSG